jgi:tripartite-type tricarboxylate transporter receptor subunit TctC
MTATPGPRGGVQDLGTYRVQGLLETNLEDWHLFLIVRNAPVLSVNVDTPFQTPQDVAAYMNENPGELTVGTSGIPVHGVFCNAGVPEPCRR